MGGINASRENNQAIAKQIQILENRLDKALKKYNEALANNKRLRENIDNLRRERLVFDQIYKKVRASCPARPASGSACGQAASRAGKQQRVRASSIACGQAAAACGQAAAACVKQQRPACVKQQRRVCSAASCVQCSSTALCGTPPCPAGAAAHPTHGALAAWSVLSRAQLEKELAEKKKEMARIIEISNKAYEARDAAQAEMAALKQQADKEQQEFEQEWKELGKMIEQARARARS
eukprot:6854829-Prymnesium_polylepis.1